MEDFQLVSIWLSGQREYESGVQLYERLGTNYVLQAMFQKGYSSYKAEKLEQVMQELLLSLGKKEMPEATKEEVIQEAQEFIIAVKNSNIKPSDLPNAPEKVKEAIKKRRNLYNEFLRLHSSLKPYTPIEIRRQNALRILDIFDEIKPLWDLTNYYDCNLKLPEEKNDTIDINRLSIVEANKLYETHYKYIRKFRGIEKKEDEIKKRLLEAAMIKQSLLERNVFLHQNLTLD